MELKILNIKNRKQLRNWLLKNSKTSNGIYVPYLSCKPTNDKDLNYINIVEEALCFGWVDSTKKKDEKLGACLRLSPRRKNSHWTYLNFVRCKRLISLGLMTKEGLDVMPKSYDVKPNKDLAKILKQKDIKNNFEKFPILYQKIRIDSIQRYIDISKEMYNKAIANFIKQTKVGKMYGQWNDFGRLK